MSEITYREWLAEKYPSLLPGLDKINDGFAECFFGLLISELNKPIPYTVTDAGRAMLKEGE
jgi:hypothetical protein